MTISSFCGFNITVDLEAALKFQAKTVHKRFSSSHCDRRSSRRASYMALRSLRFAITTQVRWADFAAPMPECVDSLNPNRNPNSSDRCKHAAMSHLK